MEALKQAFLNTNREVYSKIADIRFSGSTAVVVFIDGKNYYTANVGDSRAMICGTDGRGVSVRAITRDHKPELPEEAERINTNGGRIAPFRDEDGDYVGPLRVWQKNNDIPGLAMTRALGDSAGAAAGVIPDPEIIKYSFSPGDNFIIIASDGVWEFLSNTEVARIILPFFRANNAEGAADALVREAHKRWTEEDEVIDDITCVIFFLEAL